MNDITCIIDSNWFTVRGVTIYLLAVFASFIGGDLLAKYWVKYIKREADSSNQRLILSLGLIERTITTTLTIFAITLVPAFFGGWLTLKTLAGWTDRPKDAPTKRAFNQLTSLVGSATSLSFAFLVGFGALIAKHFFLTAHSN